MSESSHLDDYEARALEVEEDGRLGRDIALVLAGAAIGAGLALLLTPKRGDEVRDAIGRGYRKTIEGLGERASDLRDRANELRDRAHDLTDDLRERAPNLLRFAKRRIAQRREG
ncbi:MAG TPA: YtxH domain-containing protein [Terriglobales bacterium]|jgi:gas vesicle protein